MERTGTVYCYRNKVNGKCYIGQTWNLANRNRKHRRMDASGRGGCTAFYSAIKKHGYDSFDLSILHDGITLQADLDRLEQEEILKHDSLGEHGYNLNAGGQGKGRVYMVPPSPETKEKCAKAARAMWERRRKDPAKLVAFSDAVRVANERDAIEKGKKFTPRPSKLETQRAAVIKRLVEEARRAVYLKSPQHAADLAAKDRAKAEAKIRRLAHPVYCEETRKVYLSASAAAREVGVDGGALNKVLRGDGHSTGGHYFRAATPDEAERCIDQEIAKLK